MTKIYLRSDRMRDLITHNNMLLMTIGRFNIPFGFGDSSVEDVCRSVGIDSDTLLAVCNLISGNPYSTENIDLRSLIIYLKKAHVSFLDATLPKIRHNLIDAINYNVTDEVSLQLIRFFDDYVAEVHRHMDHEDKVIFQYVENLLNGEIDDNFSIDKFSVNHSHMATKLQELKDIFIYHYKHRDSERLSHVLFDIIVCERDFMSHFDVESNIFVPVVKRLEESLRTRQDSVRADADDEPESADPQLASLSEREKDIIKCVARGMSNKEIADTLCLSIHTVTTHRRNLCAKLSIHSAAGLTIFAILHHLVNLDEVTP